MNFESVSQVYSRREQLKLWGAQIPRQDLWTYIKSSREFLREMPEELRSEDMWKRVRNTLYQVNQELVSLPLPFSKIVDRHEMDLIDLEAEMSKYVEAFPTTIEQARRFFSRLRKVGESDDNPLMECAQDTGIIKDHLNCVIVVRGVKNPAEWKKSVERCFLQRGQQAPQIFTSLRGINLNGIERLVTLGYPPDPSEAYYAPIAPEIVHLGYSFMPPPRPGDPVNNRVDSDQNVWEQCGLPAIEGWPVPDVFQANDPIPEKSEICEISRFVFPEETGDWFYQGSSAQGTRDEDQDGILRSETMEAIKVRLESGHSVFLRADEDHEELVCRFEDGKAIQDKIPVSELRKGDYVFIIKSGAGDLLTEWTWSMLGAELSAKVKNSQERWKNKLEEMIHSQTGLNMTDQLKNASDFLEGRGVTKASSNNLKNWINRQKILPNDQGSFRIIMDVIELKEVAEESWGLGVQLRAARTKVGYSLNKQLREHTKKIPPEQSEDPVLGPYEFESKDKRTRTLSLYRVADAATKQVFNLKPGDIGELEESDIWPE